MRLEEYKITTSKELTKFIKGNKCTVIKFSAKWCGPCKSEKFLGAYHELKDKYASHKNIKFIEMDIDLDEQIINDKTYYICSKYNIKFNICRFFNVYGTRSRTSAPGSGPGSRPS